MRTSCEECGVAFKEAVTDARDVADLERATTPGGLAT
jgi:hypothetical protein